jgi:multidrug resistance efflux pump
VYVKDGHDVRQGDSLIQLDARETLLRGRSLESRVHFTEIRLDELQQQIDDAISLDKQTAAVEALESGLEARTAQASLDQASLRFTRSRELLEEGLIAQQQHDESRTALAQAAAERARISSRTLDLKRAQTAARIRQLSSEATPIREELAGLYHQLEQTRIELDRLTVASPVDGRISALIPLHAGEHLAAGTAIATLIPDSHRVIVESWLPADDRNFVAPGQLVRLRNTDELFDGNIISISADTLDGAYRIRIAPQRDALNIGAAYEVHYVTRQERLLYLPFIRIVRAARK